jgi:hypothetical protein
MYLTHRRFENRSSCQNLDSELMEATMATMEARDTQSRFTPDPSWSLEEFDRQLRSFLGASEPTAPPVFER